MNTPFTEIYEIFLQNIADYRYDNLATKDEQIFYKQLKGILLSSMHKYKILDYDDTLDEFNCELNMLEKGILANCMEETWFTKFTQDLSAMSSRMRGRDVKGESSAIALKRNSEHLATIIETRRQLIIENQLHNLKERL